MDYSTLPLQLVYKKRKSLEEFTHDNEMNEYIVDRMTEISDLQCPDFKNRATIILNTAYYICTLILVDEHPEWNFIKYKDIAVCNQRNDYSWQAITLSLVKIYLIHFNEKWRMKNRKILNNLDAFLEFSYTEIKLPDVTYCEKKNVYEHFYQLFPLKVSLSPSEFSLRVIDQEAIEDIRFESFNWTHFTNFYREDEMRDIVFNVGKTEDEMRNLVDSLRHDASLFYVSESLGFESANNRLEKIEQDIHHHFHAEEETENEDSAKEEKCRTEKQSENTNYDLQLQKKDEELRLLKEELETYHQEPFSDNPHDKVRLEVVCKLLEESGANFDAYGNKAEAARLAHYITGLPFSTCKNYMTNRDLNTTEHNEEVLKTNTSIKKIGINWQL